MPNASEKYEISRCGHAVVGKLAKEHKAKPIKTADLLDRVLQILQEYPLRSDERDDSSSNAFNPLAGLSSEDLQPEIILSESFDNPDES